MKSAHYAAIIDWVEAASSPGAVIDEVAAFTSRESGRVDQLINAEAYLEAAIEMLPAGVVWRKYTDDSVSIYAASPYGGPAQVRHDGTHRDPAIALCAALLRLLLAPILKAEAAERRRLTQSQGGPASAEKAAG